MTHPPGARTRQMWLFSVGLTIRLLCWLRPVARAAMNRHQALVDAARPAGTPAAVRGGQTGTVPRLGRHLSAGLRDPVRRPPRLDGHRPVGHRNAAELH